MRNRYLHSFLTATLSILPMIILVMVLSVIKIDSKAIVSLSGFDYVSLIIGAVILIFGLGLFQIGTTKSLTKVGEYMGSSLSKQSKIFVVILFSFLLGALITCAEPSILIVATQVNIPSYLLIGVISLGVGIFVVVGVIRIISHGSLKLWYLFFYFLVFCLVALIAVDKDTQQYLPFIFDSGGITTGSATVPFILALGAGIAAVRGGKNATDDSFGLVGVASVGPILSMIVLIMVNRSGFSEYHVVITDPYTNIGQVFGALGAAMIPQSTAHLGTLIETAMALIPIIIIFIIYELIFIKLPRKEMKELIVGFLFTFCGLVLFLTGVNAIMTPFGTRVGLELGHINGDIIIVIIAFVIGLVTILCEPAVHVLTEQINVVSDGQIKKRTVLIALSVGVGVALGLSVYRSLANFNILYILVPGYLLSIIFMFIAPNIYTAMAFDAGGTASGPMSVSFILPLIIGMTYSKHPEYTTSSVQYYTQSFGVVALIAMTPILAIQLLGVYATIKKKYHLRVMSGRIKDPEDAQIIHF